MALPTLCIALIWHISLGSSNLTEESLPTQFSVHGNQRKWPTLGTGNDKACCHGACCHTCEGIFVLTLVSVCLCWLHYGDISANKDTARIPAVKWYNIYQMDPSRLPSQMHKLCLTKLCYQSNACQFHLCHWVVAITMNINKTSANWLDFPSQPCHAKQ